MEMSPLQQSTSSEDLGVPQIKQKPQKFTKKIILSLHILGQPFSKMSCIRFSLSTYPVSICVRQNGF